MSAAPQRDTLMWDSSEFAKTYTSAETVTGPYAQDLVVRTILPDLDNDNDLVVLDLACGTGVVAAKLMDMLGHSQRQSESDSSDKGDGEGEEKPTSSGPRLRSLTCSDFADAMVDAVAHRIEACGWPNAKAIKADAMDTNLPSAEYTHILMNFGPMLLPDWRAGLREMHRMLRPGGTLGLASWKKVGWYADVRDAFATDPDLPAMGTEEGLRKFMSPDGCWDDEGWVKQILEGAGFGNVVVEVVPHTSVWAGVDEFLPMIRGSVGFAISGAWSKEQQVKHGERAKSVVESFMREKYGAGEISWEWIAILTTAKKLG
ncbi:hypothetical protein A1O1_06820 [Capronia coronata CBS 617.96]|uniref:Uncharacterized protein n=1 Tax=Capronia coronata CBS 617.96 TaxID=1182541 RepID=W9Y1S8_9EURO|nr:uncharacterized protein A1O1_06820 [Capronia coronata CBS 617.96]EXJ83201.1 hypothetical protein A1O1_06820 [Capronia coronata CBS 617.96]